MGFTHTRGSSATNGTGTNHCAVTLGAAPATGSLVCVGVLGFSPATVLSTVQDGNGNPYVITPNSPSSVNSGTAGYAWLAYLLSAPSNAHATITATFNNNLPFNFDIFADEFAVSGGTQVFDKDIVGNGNGATVNTPTITPTNSGSLLFAYSAAGSGISSANSPWSQAGGAIATDGSDAEYVLSASAGTAVNFSQTPDTWDAIAMAFYISSGAAFSQVIQQYGQTQPISERWQIVGY